MRILYRFCWILYIILLMASSVEATQATELIHHLIQQLNDDPYSPITNYAVHGGLLKLQHLLTRQLVKEKRVERVGNTIETRPRQPASQQQNGSSNTTETEGSKQKTAPALPREEAWTETRHTTSTPPEDALKEPGLEASTVTDPRVCPAKGYETLTNLGQSFGGSTDLWSVKTTAEGVYGL